jgi:Flp pilus assembly protein TadD
MNQPLRFSSAASLVVLGSMMAGCAAPQSRVANMTHLGGKVDSEVGLATRALAALNSNNVPMAIDLAERAVAKTPNDAGFRALLANTYFAGGRFHSAEQAYRDALTLSPNQPQILLKLALVEIAQGKNAEAISLLRANSRFLDPSDFGLAMALAGRPSEAIAVLDPAARTKEADATVRQNLAFAHALAGDWTEARTIAAQDVPASQLEARIQQWMQLATPKRASDQVAALLGVTPAAADVGQPAQLALNKGETQQAEASIPVQVAKAPVSQPQISQAAQSASASPSFAAATAPVAAVAPAPPPPRSTIATLAASAVSEAKEVLSSILPHHSAPVARPAKARVASAKPALRVGKSPTVVQLGAYQSSERVLAAWQSAAHKYGALKAYVPMSARFASPKGTFYRLSVRGFNSLSEANALCNSVRRKGGSCFVRNFAGDAPVQYASR